MFRMKPPFISAIEGEQTGGSAGGTAAQNDAQHNQAASKTLETGDDSSTSDDEDSDDDADEDPNARGSKPRVLADLARERDRRQASEAENAELKAKLEQFERAQMSEQERKDADLAKALERIKELEAEKEAQEHKEMVMAAVTAANLPAEMADRLKGETADELATDAKKLAETMGFDKTPIDPSQGKNTGGKTQARTLSDALRDHYTQNR